MLLETVFLASSCKAQNRFTLKPALGAKAEAVAATAAARTIVLADMAMIGMRDKTWLENNNITRHFISHVSARPRLVGPPEDVPDSESERYPF